jgi:glutathione peroxidase
MRTCILPALLALLTGIGAAAADSATPPETTVPTDAAAPVTEPAAPDNPTSALDFTMLDMAGKPQALSQYKGKVVMLVNVASHCGFTPQYAGLETIYSTYKDQGFVILGVPANDFGKQEPGTPDEIVAFCTSKYHVTFPLLAKTTVKGEGICPLYTYLTALPPKPGPITWNFCKFLIGRDGALAARWDSKAKPESAEVTSAIEAALGGGSATVPAKTP